MYSNIIIISYNIIYLSANFEQIIDLMSLNNTIFIQIMRGFRKNQHDLINQLFFNNTRKIISYCLYKLYFYITLYSGRVLKSSLGVLKKRRISVSRDYFIWYILSEELF